uniref:Uncharacterized protein n=1 Tax=Escherichia coli TaxID=562 RepID=A0A2S1JCX8_ECOLX|nr:hypothetical protein [Escherichia coli]
MNALPASTTEQTKIMFTPEQNRDKSILITITYREESMTDQSRGEYDY